METGWEALGGLLGELGRRGGGASGASAAGLVMPRVLCAAALMWCTQQQPSV